MPQAFNEIATVDVSVGFSISSVLDLTLQDLEYYEPTLPLNLSPLNSPM